WCEKSFKESTLVPALSRDVFEEPTQRAAKSAFALGLAHRKLKFTEANLTPLGAVIAAPRPEARELFCRNGLKYFAGISSKNIHAALHELRTQSAVLEKLKRKRGLPVAARISIWELELAARMAEHSCKFMLWQQALASGEIAQARRLAKSAIKELIRLE